MDMNAAYELEGKAHCPHAEVIFDLFHVAAEYSREVIHRLRVDEANRFRQDRPARRILKSARCLLLRKRERACSVDQVRLDESPEANTALMTVFDLRDDLKAIWQYRNHDQANTVCSHWYKRTITYEIKTLQVFAYWLQSYLHGTLVHCQWYLHTGLTEVMNNRIKVIKRIAYGHRNEDYSFPRIRAAFSGVAR